MHPVNTYVSHTVHFVPTHFQCFPCLYSSIFNYKLHCAVRAYLQYAGGKCHLVGTIKRNEGGLEVLVVARYNPRPTKWVMDSRWRCWKPRWGYEMMLIWYCLFVFYFRSKFSLACLCVVIIFMHVGSTRSVLPLQIIVMDNIFLILLSQIVFSKLLCWMT